MWSYSIKHKDESTLKQYFKLNSLLTDYIGPYFTSKLISTGKGNLKQLEYDPIVNPRVHKLGNHTGITNTTF